VSGCFHKAVAAESATIHKNGRISSDVGPQTPIASMGLVYLPYIWLIFMVNVGTLRFAIVTSLTTLKIGLKPESITPTNDTCQSLGLIFYDFLM